MGKSELTGFEPYPVIFKRLLNGLAQIGEDRDALLTTLGAIEERIATNTRNLSLGLAEIYRELDLDTLGRIRAVFDGFDHTNFDLLSPELMGEKLEAILEILAE